jgi:hypothetical protein
MLPPKLPKKSKRDGRWISRAHRDFVRSHACCKCGSMVAIEFAHVRLGSNAGMGRKPDDWRGVSLCHDCHNGTGKPQHNIGERSFWRGIDLEALIDAFIEASPRRQQIKDAIRERANG